MLIRDKRTPIVSTSRKPVGLQEEKGYAILEQVSCMIIIVALTFEMERKIPEGLSVTKL